MTLDLEQTLQKRLDESSARKLSQLVSSQAQNAGADMRAVFFHFAAHDWMTDRFFPCLSCHYKYGCVFSGSDQRAELAFAKQIEKDAKATPRNSEGT